MKKQTYLVSGTLVAGLVLAGISMSPLASTKAEAQRAPALPQAPKVIEDAFSSEMNLDKLSFPEGVNPPTILDLVPEADGVDPKDIRVYDGAESVQFTVKPGTAGHHAVASEAGSGNRAEVQVDKGDLAIMRALHWQCAWVREYVDAANAGNEAAQKTAADQLATFPNLAAVRDYGPDLAGIQEDVITPMVSGDTAAGENWLAKSCGGIFPK